MANTGFLIQPNQKLEVVTTDYPTMGDFPTIGADNTFYKDLSSGLVYRYVSGAYAVVNPAVDAMGQLCADSGNPQAIRDTPLDDPEYRVLNTTACPIDSGDEVSLTWLLQPFNENTFSVEFYLSEALDNDLTIDYKISFDDAGPKERNYSVIMPSGDTTVSQNNIYEPIDSVSGQALAINSLSPNPNGTKTIIY